MRRAAKVDANHAEVVKALRAAGCSVLSLAAVGRGTPDILVGLRNRNVLMEIKDGSLPPSHKRLSKLEAHFAETWRGQVAKVETVEEALLLMSQDALK